MFKRLLTLTLPAKKSAFLWGARQTGKSTYLKTHFPKATWYDLLKFDVHARLEKNPHHLREEITALTAEQLEHLLNYVVVHKQAMRLNILF